MIPALCNLFDVSFLHIALKASIRSTKTHICCLQPVSSLACFIYQRQQSLCGIFVFLLGYKFFPLKKLFSSQIFVACKIILTEILPSKKILDGKTYLFYHFFIKYFILSLLGVKSTLLLPVFQETFNKIICLHKMGKGVKYLPISI